MAVRVLSERYVTPASRDGLSVILVLAIGLWTLFSLPPVLLSGVFPMDMHFFVIGKHLQDWLPWILWPDSRLGRYFPVYWLFYIAEFSVFGSWVGGYLAIQSVVLAVVSVLAATLVVRTTSSLLLAGLMVVLCYFNTPLAENISTVGKSEPLACFLILAALLMFYSTVLSGRNDPRRKSDIWRLAGSAALILLAIWTKETSVVALGVALSGLVLSSVAAVLWRRADIRAQAGAYLRLVCALLLVVVISQAHYLHAGEPQPGAARAAAGAAHYVTFKMTAPLVASNVLWYIEQQPDVFAFGLAAPLFLFVVGRNLWRDGAHSEASRVRDYIFMFSVFAAAAVYYCVMWLWRWPMSYYMLFPSIGFKVSFLYGTHASGVWQRAGSLARWSAIALIALALPYAALYCYYVVFSQVAYSRLYTDALSRFLQTPEAHKTVIVESYPYYSEQIDMTGTFLKYFIEQRGGQQSVVVGGILDTIDPYVSNEERPGNAEMMRMLGVTREGLEDNFKHLPKKGDYLLTFTGAELGTWFLRGVAPYYSEESALARQGAYDLRVVADGRETMPAVYVDLWTGRPACGRPWLGYKLYQVLNDEPRFVWRGRYPDGWTEGDSSLTVNPSYGRPVIIKFSAPAASLPQKLTIKRDGVPYKELALSSTDEQTVTLVESVDKPVQFEFVVDHIFRPDQLHISQDSRPTGVLLRLDSMPAPRPPQGVASCLSW